MTKTTIEQRLEAIEQRNRAVTDDKAWETSWVRRGAIALITYVCACILFVWVLPAPNWYLAACVPVMGYLLSTLGLPWVRRFYESI